MTSSGTPPALTSESPARRGFSPIDSAGRIREKKKRRKKVVATVNRNEHKRRQSAPGVKTISPAFGKDRRFPITNFYEKPDFSCRRSGPKTYLKWCWMEARCLTKPLTSIPRYCPDWCSVLSGRKSEARRRARTASPPHDAPRNRVRESAKKRGGRTAVSGNPSPSSGFNTPSAGALSSSFIPDCTAAAGTCDASCTQTASNTQRVPCRPCYAPRSSSRSSAQAVLSG